MNYLFSKWGVIVLCAYVPLQTFVYLLNAYCSKDGECLGEVMLISIVNLPSFVLSFFISFPDGWLVYSVTSTVVIYFIVLVLERTFRARTY